MEDLSFCSDYMRGCAPEILDALTRSNLEATVGYGADQYTAKAKELIANACGLDKNNCLVELLVGGTQTNRTVIDALLRSYEGVIAADSAHISVHEAGAIEAGGHKVLTIKSENGKIKAEDVKRYLDEFYADETYPHMVAPGMVYISQPTELGTLYSLKELEDLSCVCHEANIKLYLDGARMAYALGSEGNDASLQDIARLTDVFYIGGTKCGALFGEAVVAKDKHTLPHFFTIVKQHGALLAKGRLLGLQFATLFEDGLYNRIGRHGAESAMALRKIFTDCGYELYIDSPTNQQFFLLPNSVIDSLAASGVAFELWGPRREGSTPVRFVTDWATTPESLKALRQILQHLSTK